MSWTEYNLSWLPNDNFDPCATTVRVKSTDAQMRACYTAVKNVKVSTRILPRASLPDHFVTALENFRGKVTLVPVNNIVPYLASKKQKSYRVIQVAGGKQHKKRQQAALRSKSHWNGKQSCLQALIHEISDLELTTLQSHFDGQECSVAEEIFYRVEFGFQTVNPKPGTCVSADSRMTTNGLVDAICRKDFYFRFALNFEVSLIDDVRKYLFNTGEYKIQNRKIYQILIADTLKKQEVNLIVYRKKGKRKKRSFEIFSQKTNVMSATRITPRGFDYRGATLLRSRKFTSLDDLRAESYRREWQVIEFLMHVKWGCGIFMGSSVVDLVADFVWNKNDRVFVDRRYFWTRFIPIIERAIDYETEGIESFFLNEEVQNLLGKSSSFITNVKTINEKVLFCDDGFSLIFRTIEEPRFDRKVGRILARSKEVDCNLNNIFGVHGEQGESDDMLERSFRRLHDRCHCVLRALKDLV